MRLRPYQEKAIQDIRDTIRRGNKSVMLQAPTGSGKTIVASAIAEGTVRKGNNCLFLVNKRDLVYQARDRFTSFGIGDEVGIIMAGEEPDLSKPIQIATIQTYHRRSRSGDPTWTPWFHDAQTIIVDEAHSSVCRTYLEVLSQYTGRVIIGMTATPARSDGRPLGKVYQDMVTVSSVRELTDQGFLVPAIYYAPEKYDLSKINIVRGDYDQKQLGGAVDRPKLVGNIFEQWVKLAGDRQTIGFAVNVKHSKHIRDEFERNGISIAHIDAHTPTEEREDIYRAFERGDIQYLTNVRVATEGSDFPMASCIQIAAPSIMPTRYIQMGGRGLRIHPGKENAIIIDHTGCVERHGLLEDDIEWTLCGDDKAWRKPKPRIKEKALMSCDMCSFIFSGRRCPNCGYELKDWGKKVASVEADLVQVGKRDKPKKTFTTEEKRRWYAMFMAEMKRLGKSDRWLLAQYKSLTGVWPRNMENISPMEPDQTCKNWLTSQRIKWAKSKRREEAQQCQLAMHG